MFLHNLKYDFIQTIRQKEIVFWLMMFPIILGTFFKMAFGNIYQKDEIFKEIPVAVVNCEADEIFKSVVDEITLFDPEYTDENDAMELLDKGDIKGIIFVGDQLSLSVKSDGLEQTIIKSFMEQYQAQKTIITDIAMKDPSMIESAAAALADEIDCIETKELSSGNMDEYIQYFFNLIAMVALFGTMTGLFSAIMNQGNLSAIGARKCISPTPKLITILASLLSAYAVQTICTFISITYIIFVLRIDMGSKLPMIYLSGAIGALAGTALGFFIGSIGRIAEGAKIGISMAVTMGGCFLSGLMVGNMKTVIAENCPIVNKINPAALISDLFYCLAIYDDYSRYIRTAASLVVMTVIFTALGFLLTRRKKYASI